VEYETDVEDERGRVEALLDKLRIAAEVLVFWLACGDLQARPQSVICQGEPQPALFRLLRRSRTPQTPQPGFCMSSSTREQC
jgi:hypothetical protein